MPMFSWLQTAMYQLLYQLPMLPKHSSMDWLGQVWPWLCKTKGANLWISNTFCQSISRMLTVDCLNWISFEKTGHSTTGQRTKKRWHCAMYAGMLAMAWSNEKGRDLWDGKVITSRGMENHYHYIILIVIVGVALHKKNRSPTELYNWKSTCAKRVDFG